MKLDEYNDLKSKALERLKKSNHLSGTDFSSKSADELLEINEIYQAELEAQNENLRSSLEKLEASSKELKLLFNHSPISMVVINKKLIVERANEKAQDFFGTRIQSLVNGIAYLFRILNEVEIPRFLKWFESKEYQQPLDIVLRTVNGKRTCQLQIKKWNPEQQSYLITIEDIHERVQLTNKYKQLAETIPDMILRVDGKGYIEYANKKAIEACKGNNLIKGCHIFELDFFAHDIDKLLKETLSDLKKVQEPVTFSFLKKRKSFHLHLLPEKNAGGDNTYLLVIEDITLRVTKEQTFYQIFQHASDGIILSDYDDEQVVFCNEKALQIFGLGPSNISTLKAHQIFNFFHTKKDYKDHLLAMKNKEFDVFEAEIISDDLTKTYLRVSYILIDIGDITYQQCFVHDVTDRKQLEQQTLQNANVFEHTSEGIMITDLNGSILSVNNAFTTITGYSKEEVIGKKPNILKSDKHDSLFYKRMWAELKKTGSWKGEVWNKKKDGSLFPELLAISLIHDEKIKPLQYVAVFSDFSEMKKNQEMLEHLAHYDPLTNLPNRLLLDEQLRFGIHAAKRNHSKIAIMFLDLDGFKNVNDTYGHSTGDKVLIEVSKRLVSLTRESDTVARLGGDEFLIALYNFDIENDIEPLVNKIIHAISEPIVIDSTKHILTVSIGITTYPDDSECTETLLRNADIAMYTAKSLGKNQSILFKEYMAEKAKESTDMFHMLVEAVEHNQFFLNYQPQFDFVKQKIVGFEALLRWTHPVVGNIPPTKFISFAEETRQIIKIGKFVIEQVCKDFYQDLDRLQKNEIKIAVNVSTVQLDEAFIAYLKSLILEYPELPEMLKIEITETAAIKKLETISSMLTQIKALGFKISLDDFGTGYSSLTAIKNLHADEIKIDSSFIKDVPGDRDDEELVSSIIALAKVMHKSIVAEGVENESTQQFLLERRCSVIQGYLFSKPVLLADAKQLLTEHEKPV